MNPTADDEKQRDGAAIRVDRIRKHYGGVAAVADVSFTVAQGETLVLLGTSGCGKTTTLRMINRLVQPSGGAVFVHGKDVRREDPVRLRRGIGYVIQGGGLFPHRSIRENILTVPRLLGWNATQCDNRVRELATLVQLETSLLDRRPAELSGGQRQRVSIARALAADPPIVLMDEPFGALDPITRQQVRDEFRRLENLIDKTIILVTHDISEAIELGDRICLMSEGRIAQLGSPVELLLNPASQFVEAYFARDRLQNELQAVRLADLGNSAARPDLSPDSTVAEALSALEHHDESLFLDLLRSFFAFKRQQAASNRPQAHS